MECFDKLLALIGPSLRRSGTAICPGERLCITLRFFFVVACICMWFDVVQQFIGYSALCTLFYRCLATGNSFVGLSYLFRVSDECISLIVFDTTNVLWNVLQDIVMKPKTEGGWLRIAAEFESLGQFIH